MIRKFVAAAVLAALFCSHVHAQGADLADWVHGRADKTFPVRQQKQAARNLAAEFRALAADARAGKYPDDDALWADVKRRTDGVLDRTPSVKAEWHDALVDVRNQLVRRSNAGEFRGLAGWADALDRVADGLGRLK